MLPSISKWGKYISPMVATFTALNEKNKNENVFGQLVVNTKERA